MTQDNPKADHAVLELMERIQQLQSKLRVL